MSQNSSSLHVFGLTGGAGSGKSEVARRFVELGIPVIEADKVGHQLLAPGHPVAKALIKAFGESILDNGEIDRQKLAQLAFADQQSLLTLNRITHPPLLDEIMRQCAALANDGHKAVIVEAAIIAEDGKRDPRYEALILVTAPESVRVERLVNQRGMDPAQARLRVQAQTPPEQKAAIADWIINNDGDFDQLRSQVDEVARQIKERTNCPMPA